MYPVIPAEMSSGAFQVVMYLVTSFVALWGLLMSLRS